MMELLQVPPSMASITMPVYCRCPSWRPWKWCGGAHDLFDKMLEPNHIYIVRGVVKLTFGKVEVNAPKPVR